MNLFVCCKEENTAVNQMFNFYSQIKKYVRWITGFLIFFASVLVVVMDGGIMLMSASAVRPSVHPILVNISETP